MGYGEVDQAEAVEDTNQDHQGTLPEEPVEGDTEAWKKPKNDATNHNDSGHEHVPVAKVAGNIY